MLSSTWNQFLIIHQFFFFGTRIADVTMMMSVEALRHVGESTRNEFFFSFWAAVEAACDVWRSAWDWIKVLCMICARYISSHLSCCSQLEVVRRHQRRFVSPFEHTYMITFVNNIDDDTSFFLKVFVSRHAHTTTTSSQPMLLSVIGLRNDKNVTFSGKRMAANTQRWSVAAAVTLRLLFSLPLLCHCVWASFERKKSISYRWRKKLFC